jgi:hypothetical protein
MERRRIAEEKRMNAARRTYEHQAVFSVAAGGVLAGLNSTSGA